MSTRKSARRKKAAEVRRTEDLLSGRGGVELNLLSLMAITAVVALLCLFGIVSLNHLTHDLPESAMADWSRVTVSEKIGPVDHYQAGGGRFSSSYTAWSSFETDHYRVLNGFDGAARLCHAITAVNMPYSGVEAGDLLDLATAPLAGVKEELLIPKPSAKTDLSGCREGFVAVGDHFEYQGKTVALLEGVIRPNAVAAAEPASRVALKR